MAGQNKDNRSDITVPSSGAITVAHSAVECISLVNKLTVWDIIKPHVYFMYSTFL